MFWVSGAFVFALLVGPIALLSAEVGEPDPADIYLVLALKAEPETAAGYGAFGAREVGPARGIFARMIVAPPQAHHSMSQAGYFLLPASAIAALCGLTPPRRAPNSREG